MVEDDPEPAQPAPAVRDEAPTATFYAGLPVAEDFDAAVDMSRYAAVPDDWWLGLADVVTSTEALGAGRYKAVNTAGPR